MKYLCRILLYFAVFPLCLTTTRGQERNMVGEISPVFEAVLHGDALKLKQLLIAGCNPNETSPWGWAPLHQAMYHRIEIAELLLDYGGDIDAQVSDWGPTPSNGWTPIFYAVSLGRGDLVTELVKRGANINFEDATGKAPLFYAVQNGRSDIVALLKQLGAHRLTEFPVASAKSTPAYYPSGLAGEATAIPELFQAVMLHDLEKVKALLSQGANPNEKTPYGWAPIHEAMNCDLTICRLLLEYGADPNLRVSEKKHSSNWTALFFAAYYGRDDLVTELLHHGALVDITDSLGRSPHWYAREQGRNDTAQLLHAGSSRK
jgi:ankyrin repeat protein